MFAATSQYYGLAGGGTLFLLEQTPSGAIHETRRIEWTDGLFDVVSKIMKIENNKAGNFRMSHWLNFVGCRSGPRRTQICVPVYPATVVCKYGTSMPAMWTKTRSMRCRSPTTKSTPRRFTALIGANLDKIHY